MGVVGCNMGAIIGKVHRIATTLYLEVNLQANIESEEKFP